ncbi:hypothetical protein GJ496_003211 [Pomphorhynchus laevis]|nr:hypothetical protein GJ496_003211 [Pomphorhynchus laevis]
MSPRRSPADTDRMVSLKVDNLTYRTRKEDLKRSFERYGDIGDVYIPRDPYSKDSLGYAFVRFYDRRDAIDALDAMDGSLVDGRPIRVQLARYGRFKNSRGGRGRQRSQSPYRRPYRRSRSHQLSPPPSHYSRRYDTGSRSRRYSPVDYRKRNGDDYRRENKEGQRESVDYRRKSRQDRESTKSIDDQDRRSRTRSDNHGNYHRSENGSIGSNSVRSKQSGVRSPSLNRGSDSSIPAVADISDQISPSVHEDAEHRSRSMSRCSSAESNVSGNSAKTD